MTAMEDIIQRVAKLEKDYENLSKRISNEDVSETVSKSTHSEIIAEWNKELSSLGIPKITTISGKRARLVAARIREYGKDSFHQCIEEVKQSTFLQGKSYRPWTGFNFDWLILPSNFPKVLEGNYNDSRNKERDEKGNSNIPESWFR